MQFLIHHRIHCNKLTHPLLWRFERASRGLSWELLRAGCTLLPLNTPWLGDCTEGDCELFGLCQLQNLISYYFRTVDTLWINLRLINCVSLSVTLTTGDLCRVISFYLLIHYNATSAFQSAVKYGGDSTWCNWPGNGVYIEEQRGPHRWCSVYPHAKAEENGKAKPCSVVTGIEPVISGLLAQRFTPRGPAVPSMSERYWLLYSLRFNLEWLPT